MTILVSSVNFAAHKHGEMPVITVQCVFWNESYLELNFNGKISKIVFLPYLIIFYPLLKFFVEKHTMHFTNLYLEVCAGWLGRLQERGRVGRGRGGAGGRDPGPGALDVRDGGAHEPRVQPAPPLHVAPGHHRPEDEPHGAAAAAAERLPDISIIKYTRLQKPGPQLQESFVHQNLSCSNISSANKVVFEDRNI